MRRSIVNLLLCPRCRNGRLSMDGEGPELVFGPLRCTECHTDHPVGEGVADLAAERLPPAGLQRSLEQPWVARSYERYLRPAYQLAMSRHRIDRESEFLLYRSLLGKPLGPILDVACGTGLFARKLARDAELGPIIGMDVSKPMIEEAVAQAREAGVMVDFVRSQAPELPFQAGALAAVVQTSALHFIQDADTLFREVARVLRPGGRYVVSTYLPARSATTWLHNKAGLYPRSEETLKRAFKDAGLAQFERMKLAPFIVVKVEKPAVGF